MIRKIKTYKTAEGPWVVKDKCSGQRLCSICHDFHFHSDGFSTRSQARWAIRNYSYGELIGGLH